MPEPGTLLWLVIEDDEFEGGHVHKAALLGSQAEAQEVLDAIARNNPYAAPNHEPIPMRVESVAQVLARLDATRGLGYGAGDPERPEGLFYEDMVGLALERAGEENDA